MCSCSHLWNIFQKQKIRLAYNIRTLVRTFVWIHKQRDQQTIQSIADITQDRILQYLFEIFEKTQDDFDFLCTEVRFRHLTQFLREHFKSTFGFQAFLSLGYMELHLKTVTHSTNTIVFAQYALKKISLVTVDRQRGVNHIQMDYLKYIVVSIMQMLENGTRIDVRDVVFHLHMVIPISRNCVLLYTLRIAIPQLVILFISALPRLQSFK